jgi:nucleoside-diphosphate kinase
VERTLILIKPDAVQRGLVGEIIARLERRGLQIVGLKFMRVSSALAKRQYREHVGKPFYRGLVEHITSAPLVAMVMEGPQAVELCRATIGATNPATADAGTIRGDYAVSIGRNLVHGSDSLKSAKREIKLFFKSSELTGYNRSANRWILE